MPSPAAATPAPPLPPPVFELDAGWLALDFVNTLSSSTGEHLHHYTDLVAFAEQAQAVTPAEADWLREAAAREPSTAQGVLERAVALRRALRGVFSALLAQRPPDRADLARLNADVSLSLSRAALVPTAAADGYGWGWAERNLARPIWPISRSAAELLVSTSLCERLRECSGPDCQWLFLDTSKNRSRQWCSMRSCGNRQKARRHYARVKQRRLADPAASSDTRGGAGAPPTRPGRQTGAGPAADASATAG